MVRFDPKRADHLAKLAKKPDGTPAAKKKKKRSAGKAAAGENEDASGRVETGGEEDAVGGDDDGQEAEEDGRGRKDPAAGNAQKFYKVTENLKERLSKKGGAQDAGSFSLAALFSASADLSENVEERQDGTSTLLF